MSYSDAMISLLGWDGTVWANLKTFTLSIILRRLIICKCMSSLRSLYSLSLRILIILHMKDLADDHIHIVLCNFLKPTQVILCFQIPLNMTKKDKVGNGNSAE